MEYYPDRWTIVKIESKESMHYRVFASWKGGYLDGDSWQLNSGIVKVDLINDQYHFHGESGSIYICHKELYGTTAYGESILQQLIKEAKDMTINRLPDASTVLSIEYK